MQQSPQDSPASDPIWPPPVGHLLPPVTSSLVLPFSFLPLPSSLFPDKVRGHAKAMCNATVQFYTHRPDALLVLSEGPVDVFAIYHYIRPHPPSMKVERAVVREVANRFREKAKVNVHEHMEALKYTGPIRVSEELRAREAGLQAECGAVFGIMRRHSRIEPS